LDIIGNLRFGDWNLTCEGSGKHFFSKELKRYEGGIMEIHTRKEKTGVVVSVKGRIDALTAPEFERNLSDWMSKGENIFLLNFSEMDYISSAGLRSILATAKKLKENQGKIFFTGLRGPVEEVFKISGFYSIFKIFTSEETAFQEM
jgi:anti-anti-sigma factor